MAGFPVCSPGGGTLGPGDAALGREKERKKKGSAWGIFFDFLYNLYKNKRAIVGGSYT